ncbi:MAG: DUF11 domain-containing protein, partial [Anaerolineales bacterium]|nr:DUF11 domain-containing protein [Anaerolineales bacterium]
HYNDLLVYDAQGQTLPAHLELAQGTLSIHVDDSQAVYPITVDPLLTTEYRLDATVMEPEQQIGFTVAVEGDTAVFGAPYDGEIGGDPEFTSNSGAIFIYHYNGTAWEMQAKLTGSDTIYDDQFGYSVAINGGRIVVGADRAFPVGGAVYVFEQINGVWQQRAKLTSTTYGRLGAAVAIYGDDIVAGAPTNAGRGAAVVFHWNGTAWVEQAILTANDGATNDQFGNAVGIDADRVVVGAWRDDVTALADAGSAYVFQRSGTIWTQQGHLIASDASGAAYFAQAVAIEGDLVAVGAPRADDPDQSGAVYLYDWDGLNWTQQSILKASDPAGWDQFGYSIYLDGSRMVIGAPGDDDGAANAGSAYIFADSGGWTQQAKVTAADPAAQDGFGQAVGLDGDRIVIGTPTKDSDVANSGAAYGFHFDGANWQRDGRFTLINALSGDKFASTISIDGDVAFIGEPLDNHIENNSGMAYVYTRSGDQWQPVSVLVGSNTYVNHEFGYAVAVEGDTAVIAARRGNTGNGVTNNGAIYIFENGGTTWTQQFILTGADSAAHDRFGTAVALDNNTIIVGASEDDDAGSASGSAYIFYWNGAAWQQQAKLTAADANAGDQFGIAVDVEGDTAVVGAWRDSDGGSARGSAYVFQRSGSTWTQVAKLTAATPVNGANYGNSVSVSDGVIAVGAMNENWRGAVYLYTFDGANWVAHSVLRRTGAGANERFGSGVALENLVLAVGNAHDSDLGATPGAGSVHIYLKTEAGEWLEQDAIAPSDGRSSDAFGTAVSLSGDVLAVGAPQKYQAGGGAYVYDLQATDLAITKSDSADPANWSSPLTYTLVATNRGPSIAQNIVITDSLPLSTTLASVQISDGSCSGTLVITCITTSLAPGAQVTVTVTVTPTEQGVITNWAEVSNDIFDFDLTNNVVSETTTILLLHAYAAPDQPTCAGFAPCYYGANGVQRALNAVVPDGWVTVLGTNEVPLTLQSGSAGANSVRIDGSGSMLWTGGAGTLLALGSGDVDLSEVGLVCAVNCAGAVAVSGGSGQIVWHDTTVTGFETAVSAPTGTFLIRGNTFDNNQTAFVVGGGDVIAYANNVTNFTQGVTLAAGLFHGYHNWWGSGATAVTVGDADAFAYRLGAAVSAWGEGVLGAAQLTAAGGSGTGIIVSHGRGQANAPFGMATAADGNSQCSPYYDYFVVDGSGLWTITLPIDDRTACDETYNDNVLFMFALDSGGAPDTSCTPDSACWNLLGGVSQAGVGRALVATLDAAVSLQGTPFVAGNEQKNDPTAVTLSALRATP